MIDMTLLEALTGLDLDETGILVTPQMMKAAKVAMLTWLQEHGTGDLPAEELEELWQPTLAVQMYRSMAALDPYRNPVSLDDPDATVLSFQKRKGDEG